jgi:hypothetical protein
MKTTYSLVQKPIHPLQGVMCQHDFLGRRIFQHRNNKRVNGFLFEKECQGYMADLRRVWDGRIDSHGDWKTPTDSKRMKKRRIEIEAVMISCRERDRVRRHTLENLAKTDWGDVPLHIHFDDPGLGTPIQRQVQSSYIALKKSLGYRADYILFLEDDLDFNRHIRHNLSSWGPVRRGTVTLASLYNPRLRERACDLRSNARIIDPNSVFGSQAFLLSKEAVEYVVRGWDDVPGAQDVKMSRLVGRLGNPIFYHAPSLVQHVGNRSTWGAGFHQAFDFDPAWKA